MTHELFTFGRIDNCSRRLQFVVGWGEGPAVRAFGSLKAARAYARDCDWVGHISVADRVTLKVEEAMPARHAEKYRQYCCHRLFEAEATPRHAAMLVAAYTGSSTKEVEESVSRGETRFTDESQYLSWPKRASKNLTLAFDILERERQLAFEEDGEVGGLVSLRKGRRW